MSEFQIGAQAIARGVRIEGRLTGGQASSQPINPRLSPNERRAEGDSAAPSGLGVLGQLLISEELARKSRPKTLNASVEALERKVLEILSDEDTRTDENLLRQVKAGPTHEIGSDAHIRAARSNNAAWLPLPRALDELGLYGGDKNRAVYVDALNELADGFVALNREISGYIYENDLTDAQIKTLLSALTTPKSFDVIRSGDAVWEEDVRSNEPSDTFGALFKTMTDVQKSRAMRDEVENSVRSLLGGDRLGNVAAAIARGGIELLNQEAERLGLTRHKDPDEQKQEISLEILNIVSEAAKSSHRWTVQERERWSQFVQEVRNAALHHPAEALAALRQRYPPTGSEG